ncbi:MAG: NUDIX hydrolase [Herpetosiphon sp.]
MRVREDQVALPNGKTTIYGVATFGDCVGVLPFIDNNHVLMIRQHRYVQRESHRWEMPTGGVHGGEALEDAVQRELREETGHGAQRLVSINSFYTSKGVCDETAHLFLAYDLFAETLPPDDTEFLELGHFLFQDVLDLVLAGEIRDSMTIVAVLWAARLRATCAER